MMLSLAAAAGTDTQQGELARSLKCTQGRAKGNGPSGGVAFCDESMFLVLICCFWFPVELTVFRL